MHGAPDLLLLSCDGEEISWSVASARVNSTYIRDMLEHATAPRPLRIECPVLESGLRRAVRLCDASSVLAPGDLEQGELCALVHATTGA